MLYPQSNPLRQVIDLSGYWDFRPDFDNAGVRSGWSSGFRGGRPIVVPASWNELFDDVRNYLGDAWYQTRFDLPWGWGDKRVLLRFGSVNYLAEVWLNGVRLGQHEGGHLPFEYVVHPYLRAENNLLVVRVEGELSPERVPPGNIPPDPKDTFNEYPYPAASFDFFPYCGIQRPVLLYATSHEAITDLTVKTNLSGANGLVTVRVDRLPGHSQMVRGTIQGHGAEVTAQASITTSGNLSFSVPDAALWSSQTPNLYELTVELMRNGTVVDRYTLPIGIRTIKVEGDTLLLNGKPVYLTGFGRHEDFPIAGRGYMPLTVIRDYELMRWVGANSFRTTHYPYSEPMLDMADRLGFMVISETPAVGLYFREDGLAARMVAWRQQTRDLMARDKNHPSVIMWSLANEPHNRRPEAHACFKEIFDIARSLDDTRPVTFVGHVGIDDSALELCDVICLNRYRGWYQEYGRIEQGAQALSDELDRIYAKFPRPLILTEFGADTVAGMHAQPPVMFSEEYQAEFVERYIGVLRSKPFVVGEHVWNLCDFRTGQAVHRIGAFNLKGVFTRDRQPKLAAHKLRALWKR